MEIIYFILMLGFLVIVFYMVAGSSFRRTFPESAAEIEKDKHEWGRRLYLPKGTVVKMGGIPIKLLHDTPYYSEHYWQKKHGSN